MAWFSSSAMSGLRMIFNRESPSVQMPEMDGYEATRRIRALADKEKAGVPIVAMSANAFEEDKKNAMSAGMNGHIAKPLDVKLLFRILSELTK